jgi:hypothetical protein
VQSSGKGLTQIYHRFHDPRDGSAAITALRRAHAEMDQHVLRAYGWADLSPHAAFRDHLDGTVRLGWTDREHDERLGRLLELNERMSEPTRCGRGTAAQPPAPPPPGAM